MKKKLELYGMASKTAYSTLTTARLFFSWSSSNELLIFPFSFFISIFVLFFLIYHSLNIFYFIFFYYKKFLASGWLIMFSKKSLKSRMREIIIAHLSENKHKVSMNSFINLLFVGFPFFNRHKIISTHIPVLAWTHSKQVLNACQNSLFIISRCVEWR